jgi:hypothetical protein
MNNRLPFIIVSGAMLVACGERVSEATDPALVEFEKKRIEKEERLEAMPVAELSQAVASDSALHVAPFNSAAVREATRRGGDSQDQRNAFAKELVATLTEPDARSHLGLITVGKLSPDVYRGIAADFRYQVLSDALAKSEYYNGWGIPHLFLDQPAGRTIICESRGIERYLYPVLDLDKPAPVFGNGEVIEEQEEYGYRVKDYAFALVNQLRGTPVEIPKSPRERDALIEQMKQVPPGSEKIPTGERAIECPAVPEGNPVTQRAAAVAGK